MTAQTKERHQKENIFMKEKLQKKYFASTNCSTKGTSGTSLWERPVLGTLDEKK